MKALRAIVALLFVCCPAIGDAQSPDSLKGVLLTLGVQGEDPFVPEQVAAFANLIALEVSTAPFGTSTGGLSFVFDPGVGTFVRRSGSFGPAFSQRSLTIGKGKLGIGFNWLPAHYNSVAGLDLRNGELRTSRNVQFDSPDDFVAFTSDLSSHTAVAFANYGLTDRLDVSVALPWIRVSLDANVVAFDRSGTSLGALPPVPTKSASGLGDVALLAKYHVWRHREGGLAAGFEVRLPTGNSDQLRGLGLTRTAMSAIWSRGGRLSPHANIGYEVWSRSAQIAPSRNVYAQNAWTYAAGIEVTPHSRATIVADVIGRRMLHGGALGYQSFAAPGLGSREVLVGLPKGVSVVSVAPGIKWNVGGNVLLTGTVLGSLKNGGLRANAVPVLGLEWAY